MLIWGERLIIGFKLYEWDVYLNHCFISKQTIIAYALLEEENRSFFATSRILKIFIVDYMNVEIFWTVYLFALW